MAKSKGSRLITTIECLDCRVKTNEDKRSPGVSRYTTKKNRKNTPERLELRKFCRFCNKHTVHKEIK
nr:ribosomal protein L33 [Meringosphaera mediterranea]